MTAPRRTVAALAWWVSLAATAAPSRAMPPEMTAEELQGIATSAYQYFYPLITMDVTRRQSTNPAMAGQMGHGPMNQFVNIREFPPANMKLVVRPNFDTLYSSGWLDLRGGPIVLTAAATDGRYYLLPMLDMWTDVFASPGKRTTGTKAGKWAIVPPGWQGELPAGVDRIDAPTPIVWIIGRTQTNGPSDYAAVHKIQDGFKLEPLAGGGSATPVNISETPIDMKTPPKDLVDAMPAEKYFTYAAELMKVNPPHVTDEPIIAQLARIGIVAGQSFDFAHADPDVRQALLAAPAAGLAAMKEKVATLATVVNGWEMNTTTMGVYGTYYLKRAIVAALGLGANLPEDAIYPMLLTDSTGKPLVGEGNYVIHFEKGKLPPVNAFWSITMYDADGFQAANPINRFAIGDRDKLKFNPDGSLDIYLQHADPGPEKQSNWLPSPASGELGVTMRLYAPRAEALEGFWTPPPVVKK
jgi:hypothetical protein